MIMKLFKMIAGGFGALAGIAALSGCTDNVEVKPVTKITQDDLKRCCGEDDGGEIYASCVKNYIRDGMCTGEDDVYYVCGENDGTDRFKSCVERYKDRVVDDHIAVDYGVLPATCCGEDDGSDRYKACMEEYEKIGGCNWSAPLYGVEPVDPKPIDPKPIDPEPVDPELKACCGEDDGSRSYEDCVEAYKEYGFCKGPDPVYGPSDLCEWTDDIPGCHACCDDLDDNEYGECANEFLMNSACTYKYEDL